MVQCNRWRFVNSSFKSLFFSLDFSLNLKNIGPDLSVVFYRFDFTYRLFIFKLIF